MVGKLAVIAPMLEPIRLKEIINQHIPADVQAEFDHGTIRGTSVPTVSVEARAWIGYTSD